MPLTPEEKLLAKLRKLFAMLNSANEGEKANAHRLINEILAKNKKTWNDFTAMVFRDATAAQGWHDDDASAAAAPAAGNARRPKPLDLIRRIFERHLYLSEHQLVAVTLWVAHTFVFDRFSHTPRLIVTSPTQGCGKSTLLEIAAALGYHTHLTDNLTVATLFRRIDRDRSAVFIDEADNQDLANDPTLRAVINGGYRAGRTVERYIKGELTEFTIYAPLALATINTLLPLPTLRRSVVIHMERSPVELTRFDPKTIAGQQDDCDIVYRETLMMAPKWKLNLDPPLPERLIGRPANNWRPFISIADACSKAWGELAREAAVALSKYQDEDFCVLVLSDIRDIFNRRPGIDRLPSATLVDDLNDMQDSPWSEWRGPRNDQTPRRLSQGQLAAMLAPFGIRPRTIWPPRRGESDKSRKGYLREQFEAAWASYCDGDVTPAQRRNVRVLGQR